MSEEYIYTTSQNNQISITTFGNQNLESSSAIIISHGFKGFKDWGFFPFTANYFAKQGFFVITFNYSHNGIGIINNEFTELEKFADNTFSLEIEELSDIISAYQSGFFGKSLVKYFASTKQIVVLTRGDSHEKNGVKFINLE